jgi:hypothetical protein
MLDEVENDTKRVRQINVTEFNDFHNHMSDNILHKLNNIRWYICLLIFIIYFGSTNVTKTNWIITTSK